MIREGLLLLRWESQLSGLLRKVSRGEGDVGMKATGPLVTGNEQSAALTIELNSLSRRPAFPSVRTLRGWQNLALARLLSTPV